MPATTGVPLGVGVVSLLENEHMLWLQLHRVVLAVSFVPLIGLCASLASAASIRGRVVDSESKAPIYRADVILMGSAIRSLTNEDGTFELEVPTEGDHLVQFKRLGYEDLTRQVMGLTADATTQLDIELVRVFVPLEEVMVTPGSFSIMDTGTSSQQTMSREDIENSPQLGEDVFRAVNRLPGLASGDYGAHFGIRGGRHDETLILLDGLELYEPYHLKDFNEGAISIVDAETIEGVQLMTGGFGAKFGNKRSGVFDITSRTVELDKNRYSVGLSFMNARAMGRGPLWNGKGSWMVSARSGFMDLVFGLISQDELPSPRYQDVFAKMQVDLNSNHSLAFNVLYAGDTYKFDAASTTGFADSIDTREYANNSYGNSYVWTTLHSTLGSRTYVRTLLAAGLVTRDRDGYETPVKTPGMPLYTLTNARDFSNAQFWQDWTIGLSRMFALNFGVDARYLDVTDTYHSIVHQDPNDPSGDPDNTYPIVEDSKYASNGRRVGAYLTTRFRFYDPLTIEVGARYDHASYTRDDDWSPRTSAALDIGGGRTLRASWGYYRQIMGIDDVAFLNDQQYRRSELTEQWSGGIEQVFGDGSLLRLDGYYKQGSELRPVYRNWKGGIDTFPEINEDRILVTPISNEIYGAEVYLDHRFNERMATRASYSYMKGEETVSNMENVNSDEPLLYDKTHRLPMDQMHAVNVDFTYNFRRVWSATGAFVYHTGWPGTNENLVPDVDDNGMPVMVLRPDKIYGITLPDYLRFDVRATRRWRTRRGEMRFFVEVVNLTNHANIFGYDYFRTKDAAGNIIYEKEEETWFSILPSLGIAWTSWF
jgi:hypothetical protein